MNKILVLVMAHNQSDEVFKNYKRVWDLKIDNVRNRLPIDIIFLYADENITEEYKLIGNHLTTKHEENYWSALLHKVISGFKYFSKSDYDLVFKTNLSTLINFDKFYEYCRGLNVDNFIYQGFIGEYDGYKFCSGAGMLLNKRSVDLVLDNLNLVNEKWTDDIFIGFVLNKLNNIMPEYAGLNRLDITQDTRLPDNLKTYTHIRIKIRRDDKDILYTNKVFNLIYC
jgi:hypothetical protein